MYYQWMFDQLSNRFEKIILRLLHSLKMLKNGPSCRHELSVHNHRSPAFEPSSRSDQAEFHAVINHCNYTKSIVTSPKIHTPYAKHDQALGSTHHLSYLQSQQFVKDFAISIKALNTKKPGAERSICITDSSILYYADDASFRTH